MARWVVLGLGLAATVWAWLIPDAVKFATPGLARILCFHLPCAMLSTLFVLVAGVSGVMYLRSQKAIWDGKLVASLELGTLFAVLTLASGIVFSKAQWGDWWHNDPRQTSFLIVCVMLGAGLALRAGLGDEKVRARATSAYGLAVQVPFYFLTFVFPRLPGVREVTLHPLETIQNRQLDVYYTTGVLGVGAVAAIAAWFMFNERARLETLEGELSEAA